LSQQSAIMATIYKILHRLSNDEFMSVASRANRKQADLLVESLKQHCPGEYEVVEVVTDAETGFRVKALPSITGR
jgi:hypothetical protein